MAKTDYYEILGVEKNANERDIKKAYKRLAMKYHPDRTKGDKALEAKFKEVKEAYEVLNDPQKRQAYDQYGHAAFEQAQGGAGGFGGGGADFADIFGDVFGDIFGGGRGRQRSRAQRGSDLRYNLELSLEEAVRGKTAELKIPSSLAIVRRLAVAPERCERLVFLKLVIFTAIGQGAQIQMRQGFFAGFTTKHVRKCFWAMVTVY